LLTLCLRAASVRDPYPGHGIQAWLPNDPPEAGINFITWRYGDVSKALRFNHEKVTPIADVCLPGTQLCSVSIYLVPISNLPKTKTSTSLSESATNDSLLGRVMRRLLHGRVGRAIRVLLRLLLIWMAVKRRWGHCHLGLRLGVRGLMLRQLMMMMLMLLLLLLTRILVLLGLRLRLRQLLVLLGLGVRQLWVLMLSVGLGVISRSLRSIPLNRVLHGIRVRGVDRLGNRDARRGVRVEHRLRL